MQNSIHSKSTVSFDSDKHHTNLSFTAHQYNEAEKLIDDEMNVTISLLDRIAMEQSDIIAKVGEYADLLQSQNGQAQNALSFFQQASTNSAKISLRETTMCTNLLFELLETYPDYDLSQSKTLGELVYNKDILQNHHMKVKETAYKLFEMLDKEDAQMRSAANPIENSLKI